MAKHAEPSMVGPAIGVTGLNRWGGYVHEEFLPELRGPKGMRKYREMSDNDEIVGAMFYAIEMLLRKVSWHVDGAPDGGRKGEEVAEFIDGALRDMSQPWEHVISEILTMLPYGFALMEVVLKKRDGANPKGLNDEDPAKRTPKSKFDDGRVGWRNWSLRSQDTIEQWVFDDGGGIQGAWQIAPPRMNRTLLPIDRCLLFRVMSRKNNPEGRSLLRNAYRSWVFKRRIQEIEGIGIERDLAGYPVLTPPEGVDLWNPNDPNAVALLSKAESIVRQIRRDEQEGMVKPFGWEFELMSSGSRRQFDTNQIIGRYDERIAMSVIADFILIGHTATGSKALAASKVTVFSDSLAAILDAIKDVINRIAIPRLCDVNGIDPKLYPTIEHGAVQSPELTELVDFVTKLAGAGVPMFPNAPIERHLLKTAGLPLPEGDLGLSDINPTPEPVAPGADPNADPDAEESVEEVDDAEETAARADKVQNDAPNAKSKSKATQKPAKDEES